MISSKIAQPRHWRTLSPVARYEPRCPSGARWSTIVGTRASAPISAATPSIAFPISPPSERREQRLLQRQAEVRGRDEDENRDPEVRPEQNVSRARARGGARGQARLPRRRLQFSPFAGIPGSGSAGVISARSRGTPAFSDASNDAWAQRVWSVTAKHLSSLCLFVLCARVSRGRLRRRDGPRCRDDDRDHLGAADHHRGNDDDAQTSKTKTPRKDGKLVVASRDVPQTQTRARKP